MIDTKALKQKILDLAMRGKLVPQDPNDEPVEELLARIREERKKLEKEKKISKVEESDIYWSDDDNCYYEKNDIPSGWSCLQLQYFSNIYTGNSLNDKQKIDLSIKLDSFHHYIATKDIDLNGNINYENGLYIPLDYSLKRAKQNSILICLEGANAGNKIGLINKDVCFVNKLACVSPFIVISKFVYYFFNSITFNNEFRDNMQGIIGGIPLSKFKSLSILIPPLQEQERIVNKIDKLFELVDKIEKDQQELEELKKQAKDKVLELAVTGKLVKQDPNDEPASVLLERIKVEKEKLIKEGKIKREKADLEPISDDDKNYYGQLPINWAWTNLSSLSKSITDGTHKTPKYLDSGIPFLSIANISSGSFDNCPKYISPDEHNQLTKRAKPEYGDILLCRIGTLGKPFIVNMTFDFSIFVSLALIKPIAFKQNEYLKMVLSSPFISNHIDRIKVGGGTHTYKINLENLLTFPIPCPPQKEQNEIISKVTELMNLLY